MGKGNAVQSLAELRTQRRENAFVKYVELLKRNRTPQSGDAEVLADCLESLGRSDHDFAADVELFDSIQAAEALSSEVESLAHQTQALAVERAEAMRWAEAERKAVEQKIEQRMEAVERRFVLATEALNQARKARSDLQSLHDAVEAIRQGCSAQAVRRERLAAANEGVQVIHGPGAGDIRYGGRVVGAPGGDGA